MSGQSPCEICGQVAAERVEISPPTIGRRAGKVELIKAGVYINVCREHLQVIDREPTPARRRAIAGAYKRFWDRRQTRLI